MTDASTKALCALLLAAVIALVVAAPAGADNSNSNTNNNDVTQVGGNDGSNGSGDSSTDEDTAWPPTGLDWPPSDLLKKADSDTNGKSASAPIVMPAGQTAPKSDTPSTTPKAKPIVVAGSP